MSQMNRVDQEQLTLQSEKMTFDLYETRAGMTMGNFGDEVALTRLEQDLLYAAAAITSEAGEVISLVKKALYHDRTGLDAVLHARLVDEAGDVLYGLAYLASTLGCTLEDIAKSNNKKLALRYPNGFKVGGGIR